MLNHAAFHRTSLDSAPTLLCTAPDWDTLLERLWAALNALGGSWEFVPTTNLYNGYYRNRTDLTTVEFDLVCAADLNRKAA